MYAPHLFRVFSYCNRSLVLSRQLLSSHPNLKSHNFVTIANNSHRFDLKCKSLISVSFSRSSSPDDFNVPKENVKKRRRIISDSSEDNESPSPSQSKDDSK